MADSALGITDYFNYSNDSFPLGLTQLNDEVL